MSRPAAAVIGRVQQHLAVGGDAPRGQPVQVRAATTVPRGVQVLRLDPGVPRGDAFLGVHHVDDRRPAGQGQPGCGLRDQPGHRRLVHRGEDHALAGTVRWPWAPAAATSTGISAGPGGAGDGLGRPGACVRRDVLGLTWRPSSRCAVARMKMPSTIGARPDVERHVDVEGDHQAGRVRAPARRR